MGSVPPKQRKTVEDEWLVFKTTVFRPQDITEQQWKTLRTVFYGGAVAMFGLLTGSELDAGLEPTDNDLAYVSRLNDELTRFADGLRSHRN